MALPEFPDDHEGPIKQSMTRRTKITIGIVAVLLILMVVAHLTGIAPHH
jgi:hypothetical protein